MEPWDDGELYLLLFWIKLELKDERLLEFRKEENDACFCKLPDEVGEFPKFWLGELLLLLVGADVFDVTVVVLVFFFIECWLGDFFGVVGKLNGGWFKCAL